MPSERRSFLATCAAGISTFAGCLSSEEPNADGTWTRRTVDDARTGHSTTDGPTTDLHAVWSRAIPDSGAVKPSPVVDDGVLYIAYAKDATVDEYGGAWVAAFDAATGNARWTTELFRTEEYHYFYCSDSLVVNADLDRLFVQTKPGLTMLSTDGAEQWTFDNLYPGQQAPDTVPPLVTADAVVTGTYASDIEDGQHEIVYGIDPVTGDARWRTEFREWSSMWQLSGADSVVYVPFTGTGLVALDAMTGAEQWRWEGAVSGTPTVLEEALLVPLDDGDGNEESLVAMDRDDGSLRWRVPIGTRWADAGLTVADGRVFLMADFGLEARSLETGERLWRFGGRRDSDREVGPQFELVSTPVVTGGAVYAPGYFQRETMYGYLFVLDTATGEELSRVEMGRNERAGRATPAVTSDLVFLASTYGNLYAFGECGFDVADYCLYR